MIEKFLIQKPYSKEQVELSKNLLATTTNLFGANQKSRLLAIDVLNKYDEFSAEVNDFAKEMNISPIDITIGNISYDLLAGLIGCSTMALTSPDGPFIARNMDWFPPSLLARASVLLPTENGIHAACIGMSGVVSGLSHNGFGFVLNAAFADSYKDGYPMLLFLRHVLDNAQDYKEALHLCVTTPLMTGGLITLVGKENKERVVIERTPKTYALRYTDDNLPLIATNHYRLLSKPTECSRYSFMVSNAGKIEPLDILTNENVIQSITCQHILIHPKKDEIKLFVPENPEPDDEIAFFMEMLA